MKAQDLNDIYTVFRETPLRVDQIDEYYIENHKARGGTISRNRISRRLTQTESTDEHILFIGYKGCGKSTELNHLQKDIADKYLVINFSVLEELDPINLNYIELFIVLMEKLFDYAKKNNLNINREYIDSIANWINSKEITEINDKYIGKHAEIGAKGEVGIPSLLKFFAKFKMSAKTSKSMKQIIKTNIEPKLSDLIDLCNDLIREIDINLSKVNKKKILLIVEDLDKLPYDTAYELFFNYTNTLTQLQTNVIFTFPVALYHHIKFNTINQYFSYKIELPMIKIENKDNSKNKDGMETMRSIVERRMSIDLFEQKDFLDQLIKLSGGVIRDLFRLIKEAADSALDMDREKILQEDIQRAKNSLKREYENNIGDYRYEGKEFLAKDYYNALIQLANSKTKKLDNSEVELHLRENLSILGYNGEGWYNIHPIIRIILQEREKI